MKNRIVILVLCALLPLSFLAACSAKKEEKKEAPVQTEAPLENVDPADYYGYWKYAESEEWIVINEDGTFEIYDSIEQIISPTEYTATPEGLYLPIMEITLYYDERGVLCTDDGFEMMKSKMPQQ